MPKIKLCTADREFSRFIRTRDKWTCQRCGHKHEEKSQGLHCSHYFSRGKEATRYHTDNCISLCYACHLLWGGDRRDEYKAFMIKKLGRKRFNVLKKLSNTYKKKDRKKSLKEVRELTSSNANC
jgi:hypothetical protein